MTIDQLISNHQALDFNKIVSDAIYINRDDLLKEQQEQLLEGKTSDGGRIGKYHSGDSYKKKKFAMNQKAGYGFVDLRLTGAFYKGIKLYFFSTGFFFRSTDWKHSILTKLYGENIYGLNFDHVLRFTDTRFSRTIVSLVLEQTLK